MVAATDDVKPQEIANFFQRISQMAKKQPKTALRSAKELEQVSRSELESVHAQIVTAEKRLKDALEQMEHLKVEHITTHFKSIRRYVPVVRKFASSAPQLVEDQHFATKEGRPTDKEANAARHERAKRLRKA